MPQHQLAGVVSALPQIVEFISESMSGTSLLHWRYCLDERALFVSLLRQLACTRFESSIAYDRKRDGTTRWRGREDAALLLTPDTGSCQLRLDRYCYKESPSCQLLALPLGDLCVEPSARIERGPDYGICDERG